MLTFSQFGLWDARFGNKMFQYAFIRSKANKLNTTYCLRKWEGDDIFDLSDPNRRFVPEGQMAHSYQEPYHNIGYNPETENIQDNTDIAGWGYFQTYKYFDRQDVLNWFRIKVPVNIIQNIHEYTAIHARYGDYEGIRHQYPRPDDTFYKKALSLSGNNKFIVFSDDANAARRYLSWLPNVHFHQGRMIDDFACMMLSNHNIICNSTFSWWAAYLNQRPGNKVIAPKLWFAPSFGVKNNDIYPPNWIII